MGLFDLFKSRPKNTAKLAKERLLIIVAQVEPTGRPMAVRSAHCLRPRLTSSGVPTSRAFLAAASARLASSAPMPATSASSGVRVNSPSTPLADTSK